MRWGREEASHQLVVRFCGARLWLQAALQVCPCWGLRAYPLGLPGPTRRAFIWHHLQRLRERVPDPPSQDYSRGRIWASSPSATGERLEGRAVISTPPGARQPGFQTQPHH